MTDEEGNRLLDRYSHLAYQVAKKFAKPQTDKYDEMVSVALARMTEAVRKMDDSVLTKEDPGGLFRTIAKRAMMDFVQSEGRCFRTGQSLDSEDPGTGLSAKDAIPDHRISDPVDEAIFREALPARSKTVRMLDVEITTPEAGKQTVQWMTELRNACFNALSPEKMTKIMQGVVKKAEEGDLAATKLILDYFAGGPAKGTTVKQGMVVRQEEEA